MAPVVDLQHCIVHCHVLDPWSKFFIEYISCRIKIFVVDAHREYKVPHLTLRHILSPRHLLKGPAGHPVMVQVILRSIVDDVSERHVCI